MDWDGDPDLWWPASRQWFLSSNTDPVSTYLSGPSELVDRLLVDPRLVSPHDLLA